MKPASLTRSRSGSAIFLVGAMVVALFILFGGFLKYSTSRRHSTGKLNSSFLAREFSSAIATLAAHQIRETELKKPSGLLCTQLALPISEMSAEKTEQIKFEPAIQLLIQKLIKANSSLIDTDFKVSWLLKKDKFETFLKAYPREKSGKLLLPVTVSYKMPGTGEKVTEEYLYYLNLNVSANLIPVLSRFCLYVQDAVAGESQDRFNQVTTDMYGNLKGSLYRPWVLNNGNLDSGKIPRRFSELLESSVGLIYLGGGRLVLGNCRGWNIAGKYGEGFHLMAEGRGDGLYTAGFINNMAILNWETGLCDDTSDDSAKYWWEMIKDGFDSDSRKNSIFRLFGTDLCRSPTLVFGNIYSKTLCAKAFKEGNDFFGPLPYVSSQDRFTDICSGGSEDFDIGYFKSVVGNIPLSTYNQKYASCLLEVPYNRAIAYILSNHKNPKPIQSGLVAKTDPLYDFITGEAVSKGISDKIPAPYSQVFTDITSLDSMSKVLERMGVPGKRTLKTITLAKNEKLTDRLKQSGYLNKSNLDINGWLYVKSPEKIVIDKPINLKSHGGIVLEKGNIEIKAQIKSSSDKCLLTLVTLDGDIIVNSSLGGSLNVSLVADGQNSGQVKFPGNLNSPTLSIKGNILMRRMAKNSLKFYAARGPQIDYFTQLAAHPNASSEETSEKNLLMFGINTNPRLLE